MATVNGYKNLRNTKTEQKARIKQQNLPLETRRWFEKFAGDFKMSGDRGWSQWRFLWMNVIYSIASYFQVNLVDKSDKMSRQSYFHFLRNLKDNFSVTHTLCQSIYTHTHTHTYIYIYVHTSARTQIHTHTHTHICSIYYIMIYIYMCVCVCECLWCVCVCVCVCAFLCWKKTFRECVYLYINDVCVCVWKEDIQMIYVVHSISF